MSAARVKKELEKHRNPKQAALLQGFFKTGKGQYGEGDVFLGIKVPVQRSVARKFKHLKLNDIRTLLNSKIHEHRLTALFILISMFDKASPDEKTRIFKFYLNNTKRINNWDLVDLSAPNIVGKYLLETDTKTSQKILKKLARSRNLWERRIAMLATAAFIRNNDFRHTLAIADLLVDDKHDLIHKAVGWMLREVGKCHQPTEEAWLKQHYRKMPRTMLRYAIERFDNKKKKFYMGK
jgi:3-methyladenine DNA glycosylase AlkD